MTNWLKSRISASNRGHSLSPLGWSIGARLVWAAGASALLWLSVIWALGR
jgi:hypothetical protein